MCKRWGNIHPGIFCTSCSMLTESCCRESEVTGTRWPNYKEGKVTKAQKRSSTWPHPHWPNSFVCFFNKIYILLFSSHIATDYTMNNNHVTQQTLYTLFSLPSPNERKEKYFKEIGKECFLSLCRRWWCYTILRACSSYSQLPTLTLNIKKLLKGLQTSSNTCCFFWIYNIQYRFHRHHFFNPHSNYWLIGIFPIKSNNTFACKITFLWICPLCFIREGW